MTDQRTHLIVAGAASLHPETFREMTALAQRLAGALGCNSSSAAWFDQGRPALATALEEAAEAGATRIVVVPCTLQWRYPDQFNLPSHVLDFARSHPAVRVCLAQPVGLTPAVEQTLLDHARSALDGPAIAEMDASEIAQFARQKPLRKRAGAAPEYVGFQHHLLVCQGRSCMSLGATDVERQVRAAVKAAGRDKGPDRIHVSRTRCLGPCSGAPAVVVYPQGDWYYGLTPDQAPDLIGTITGENNTLAGQRFRPA